MLYRPLHQAARADRKPARTEVPPRALLGKSEHRCGGFYWPPHQASPQATQLRIEAHDINETLRGHVRGESLCTFTCPIEPEPLPKCAGACPACTFSLPEFPGLLLQQTFAARESLALASRQESARSHNSARAHWWLRRGLCFVRTSKREAVVSRWLEQEQEKRGGRRAT